MTDTRTGTGPTADDPAAVRAQIAETRQALGDTVEALAAKTDVKGRVTAKVDERKAQLHDQGERIVAQARDAAENARQRPIPIAVVATLLALLATALLVRRTKR
jgi:ElaB/YqjD/DUF883 family membrane-anchored ribosome-binding protein